MNKIAIIKIVADNLEVGFFENIHYSFDKIEKNQKITSIDECNWAGHELISPNTSREKNVCSKCIYIKSTKTEMNLYQKEIHTPSEKALLESLSIVKVHLPKQKLLQLKVFISDTEDHNS